VPGRPEGCPEVVHDPDPLVVVDLVREDALNPKLVGHPHELLGRRVVAAKRHFPGGGVDEAGLDPHLFGDLSEGAQGGAGSPSKLTALRRLLLLRGALQDPLHLDVVELGLTQGCAPALRVVLRHSASARAPRRRGRINPGFGAGVPEPASLATASSHV
jgi:hypothetical protein